VVSDNTCVPIVITWRPQSDSQAKPSVQLVVRREKDIWVGTTTQRVSKGVVHDLEAGVEIGLSNKISI
jgi:hypothetical protein